MKNFNAKLTVFAVVAFAACVGSAGGQPPNTESEAADEPPERDIRQQWRHPRVAREWQPPYILQGTPEPCVELKVIAGDEAAAAPTEWWRFALIITLVGLSGLFSGLTLGLLSLDIVGLEIVIASGTEAEARYARKIKPLRAQGNLLLCTLLLGNTCVNAMLAILFADLTSGLVGLLVSTVTIVIVGEITPQAVCSRHALRIGANTTWLVWFFMAILFPAAWPISRVLDLTLGEEVGTIYNKGMLKKMIEIHAEHPEISKLQRGDAQVVVGALDFAAKPVRSIMTPLEDVFMLEMDRRLDRDTLEDILNHGHSRIPVYEGTKQTITDILIVKDLALLNPDDGVPVRMIIDDYGRKVQRVFHDATLGDLLNFFKTKRIHLAVVMQVVSDGPGDPSYENIGIVTLEDLFEEIIQDEIVDETDLYVDVGAGGDKVRNSNRAVDYSSARHSFRKRKMAASITDQQAAAVCSYLSSEVEEFRNRQVSIEVLRRLIQQQRLGRFKAPTPPDKVAIYTRGVPTPNFTLVLEGRLRIESGPDKFLSEAGPWSILGRGALTTPEFVPDFTATVIEDVTLLVISAREYAAAKRATSVAAAGTDVLSNLKFSAGDDGAAGEAPHLETRAAEMSPSNGGGAASTAAAAAAASRHDTGFLKGGTSIGDPIVGIAGARQLLSEDGSEAVVYDNYTRDGAGPSNANANANANGNSSEYSYTYSGSGEEPSAGNTSAQVAVGPPALQPRVAELVSAASRASNSTDTDQFFDADEA